MKRVKVACVYDFDKTLSPQNMQNYELIPKLGYKTPAEFWREVEESVNRDGTDGMLAYLKHLVGRAKAVGLPLTEKTFRDMGKGIEFFPGVEGWFDNINRAAAAMGVELEHYIVSAGIKEMIEGTSIADKFKMIFASAFVYDSGGVPVWPKQVVNYTAKTQYLARISKGTLDLADSVEVNQYVEMSERPIPFSNMIYFGDSETDIPAMRMVKLSGGYSIGVHSPDMTGSKTLRELFAAGRIDYCLPADYRMHGPIYDTVTQIIEKIKTEDVISKAPLGEEFVRAVFKKVKIEAALNSKRLAQKEAVKRGV